MAVAVATSGIVATLLPGDRTAHSTFKLPLNLNINERPVCNISKGTGAATLLQEARIIIWDECTMAHRKMLEALDRSLRDIRNTNSLMGGLTVLLSGDFRQTRPVIPKGTPADELNACLKASPLWAHVNKLTLRINMRIHLQQDAAAGKFSEVLLKVGNGAIPANDQDEIQIPQECGNIVTQPIELLARVYPNLVEHQKGDSREWMKWLSDRAILAPRNDVVELINTKILQKLDGTLHLAKSVDTVVDQDQVVHYPQEFLHSLQPAGVPPHVLMLKKGAPIMLLRNLDAPRLCNGTRLVVDDVRPNVIAATIMTGCAKGQVTYIPRIPIIPGDLPFEFKRLQFPVRLAFAMTINKSQGQTFKVAGVDLTSSCFSHGQLYVACSRVGTSKNLFLLAPNKKTVNVVYKRALQ